ncbi:MAG: hypothetical protein N2234_08840 [Planctomycetota bacterium]|nr:hypothetical protein [Planctomycetota bacterium]
MGNSSKNGAKQEMQEAREKQKKEERYKVKLICMRCGFEKTEMYDPNADEEKICPKCSSNSIRIKKV